MRSIDTAQRDAQAAHLKTLGLSLPEIADLLGYKTPSGVWRAIKRAIDAAPAQDGAALQQLEVEKLDGLERMMWTTIGKRHHLAQRGRIVADPESGEPMTDDGPLFAAADRLLRVAERRSKLLGLDSPIRVHTRSDTELDSQIQSLLDELAGRLEAEPGEGDGA